MHIAAVHQMRYILITLARKTFSETLMRPPIIRFLKALQRMADEFGVAVVITNQVVQADLGGGASMFSGPGIKVRPITPLAFPLELVLIFILTFPAFFILLHYHAPAHWRQHHGTGHHDKTLAKERKGRKPNCQDCCFSKVSLPFIWLCSLFSMVICLIYSIPLPLEFPVFLSERRPLPSQTTASLMPRTEILEFGDSFMCL